MVRREDLLEQLWPGTFVEDNRLSDNVSTLRKFLGDTAKHSKFIETIPKYGYRFVAEIREVSDETIALVDQRKTHIVIEEHEDDKSVAAFIPTTKVEKAIAAAPSATTKTIWLQARFLAPVAILLALVSAGAIWLIRSGRNARGSVLPMMQTIQFTSFTSNEFDPALSPDGKLVAF